MNNEPAPRKFRRPLWKRLAGCFRAVWRAVVQTIFVLYYVGIDRATPKWAKGVLLVAAASFFSIDALLDLFLPPLGIEASFGSVVVAAGVCLISIRKRHLIQARDKAARWFPDDDVIELD
jgi:uncharacterized membrane protein YkvA (DUF1232 family)